MIAHSAAVGSAVGAWLSLPVPPPVVGVAVACALWWRRAPVVLTAALAIGSLAGARASDGLDPPDEGEIASWVTLVDDPRPTGTGGLTVTVRWQGRRLEASAYGRTAARLDDRLAGERVLVEGRVRPSTDEWLRWRHTVGRLTVERVLDHSAAAPVFAGANWIRRRLAHGAESLSRDHRSLFAGMVLGDDRDQSPVTADDFRAAGLGHLLVVSGQNVAFVLALAAPVTVRFRPGGRLVAVIVILLGFAVVTRFEPSVMRAVTMAALAVGSAVLGRPEDGRRVLAAAVALLVVIDPFLVHSLAFQLSVAATAGIVWLTPRLAEALPGPRPLALAAATTIGAQVAVTPLLVVVFGRVPVASLPANLLVGPASGPVMMWGFTAGLLAGVMGGRVAELVHWPTAALLWWIETVARAAALAPPVALDRWSGALMVVAVMATVAAGRGWVRRLSVCTIGVVMIAAAVRTPQPPAGWSSVPGADIWRSAEATVVVLDEPRSADQILESLRTAGVGRPDLVVAADGDAADARAVVALTERFAGLAVLAPPDHRVPGARSAGAGQLVRLGDTTIDIVATDPAVLIEVSAPNR